MEPLRLLDSIGSVEINVFTNDIEKVVKLIFPLVKASHVSELWVLYVPEYSGRESRTQSKATKGIDIANGKILFLKSFGPKPFGVRNNGCLGRDCTTSGQGPFLHPSQGSLQYGLDPNRSF